MKHTKQSRLLSRRAILAAPFLVAALQPAMAGSELVRRNDPSSRGVTSPNLVRAAQRRLNETGHDAGSADGLMGPKTRRAIRSFQAANKMDQTGELDRALMVKLGLL